MNQPERIKYMEESLDLLTEALKELELAAERYRLLLPRFQELSDYYSGPLWRQDFEDDERGTLPPTLKRGVLSEDGVYNFLSDHVELMKLLKELTES